MNAERCFLLSIGTKRGGTGCEAVLTGNDNAYAWFLIVAGASTCKGIGDDNEHLPNDGRRAHAQRARREGFRSVAVVALGVGLRRRLASHSEQRTTLGETTSYMSSSPTTSVPPSGRGDAASPKPHCVRLQIRSHAG
jgi:hypothetical protein